MLLDELLLELLLDDKLLLEELLELEELVELLLEERDGLLLDED